MSGANVGQEKLADLLQGNQASRMRSVLELIGYDRLELFAERLRVEYGRDTLTRLHLTHVLFHVRWPLQLATIVRVFWI